MDKEDNTESLKKKTKTMRNKINELKNQNKELKKFRDDSMEFRRKFEKQLEFFQQNLPNTTMSEMLEIFQSLID